MSCLMLISHSLDEFSPTERKIADYILDKPNRVIEHSSQELALVLDVSQSSIIKFTQKLGFKGFSKFKYQLSEDIGRHRSIEAREAMNLHNSITMQDSLAEIAEKLLLEKYVALRETTDAIDPDVLKEVIATLNKAKRIQIVGIGGSALIAKDFAYKLLKIGLPVLSEFDSHVQLSIAQTLTTGDVLIAISYSGQRKEVLLAAEVAKQHGASLVVITSLRNNPLKELADYVLYSIADENRWRSSSISSRTAQNTITDLLFIGLVQKNKNRANQLIQDSQQLVNQLKS